MLFLKYSGLTFKLKHFKNYININSGLIRIILSTYYHTLCNGWCLIGNALRRSELPCAGGAEAIHTKIKLKKKKQENKNIIKGIHYLLVHNNGLYPHHIHELELYLNWVAIHMLEDDVAEEDKIKIM